jgi:diguanylate cyclase (GGDEF)-like protein
MSILKSLEKINKTLLVFLGFLFIGIIGIFDFLSGTEFSLSVFYVFPISLIIWRTNQKIGYIASIASVAAWFLADLASGLSFSHPVILVWNLLIRFIFFGLITFLLSSLINSLNREKGMSRTDYLTSAANSRRFNEIVQMEIDRFRRYQHPFTIAYFDIDNFKSVNDLYGHNTGDLVLQTVACSVIKKTRKSDLVARLGGDEFAIFFPETDQENARILFAKVHNTLMDEMKQHNWSVTFSIGVLTCHVAPDTTDELVKIVDELMYSAKADGKNTVKYAIYASKP